MFGDDEALKETLEILEGDYNPQGQSLNQQVFCPLPTDMETTHSLQNMTLQAQGGMKTDNTMDVMQIAVQSSPHSATSPFGGDVIVNINNPYYVNSPESVLSPSSASQCPAGSQMVTVAEYSPMSSTGSAPLPSMQQIMGPPNTANQPIIQVFEMPDTIRFRYESEITNVKPEAKGGAPERSVKSPKLKVQNFAGPIAIYVDLVTGTSGEPHVNQIYMNPKKSEWIHDPLHNLLYLQTNQTSWPEATYDLPCFGVMRMKKGNPTASARSTPFGRATPQDSSASKVQTDRVLFRFRIVLNNVEWGPLFFAVLDSKSSTTVGQPKIVHINPRCAKCRDETEVTILCDNITQRARVYFFDPNGTFRKEAVVTHRHRKFALVVKTPKFAERQGAAVKVFITVPGSNQAEDLRSEPADFNYYAESDTSVSAMKRPFPGEETKLGTNDIRDKLKNRIKARRTLQTDGEEEADSTHELVDEEEEDEDEVDTATDGPHEAPCMDERGTRMSRVAFLLAEFAIMFDERLCEEIAASLDIMASLNEKKQTPLASAILYGNREVVESFLKYMPPEVVVEVLSQRITDSCLSHLLLAAYAEEYGGEMINALIDAGDDPMAVDADGNTLLHLLIRNNNQRVLIELLSDTSHRELIHNLRDQTNQEGRGPLHQAVLEGQVDVVDALLKAGADVNLQSLKTRLTPLHFAVLEGKDINLVKGLLSDKKIDVNAKTLAGKTALDLANEREDRQYVRNQLLEAGGLALYEEEDDDEEEDDEDDDDDDDEEEEEEEVDRSEPMNVSPTPRKDDEMEEVDAVEEAPALQLCPVSWDTMRDHLRQLPTDELCRLAEHLDFSRLQCSLLRKTSDPIKFFCNTYKRPNGAQLRAGLDAIGKHDMARVAAQMQDP